MEIVYALWDFLAHLMHLLLLFLFQTTHSYGLSIILLTLTVKILLTPLTIKQFKSMAGLQKLQPKMKEIQEKHKQKPQEMQKRMMELYKQHGVNPFSSCLSFLPQLPILILLYRTVMSFRDDFVVRTLLWSSLTDNHLSSFADTSFLWMPSLLSPDLPLLVMYAFSMYASQKLTMMPSPDPAQQQSQNMMSIMMPMMFFMMFQTFPSAFILYWLTFNVLSTGHQYIHMYPTLKEERLKQKMKDEQKQLTPDSSKEEKKD